MSPFPNEDYTVGWICNSKKSLLAAAAMQQGSWLLTQTCPTGKQEGFMMGEIGEHKVAATIVQCHNQALTGAPKNVVRELLETFPNIRVLLVVGIASGMPDYESEPVQDIRLADVVVGAPSKHVDGDVRVYYEGFSGFRLKRTLDNVPTALRAALDKLQVSNEPSASRVSPLLKQDLDCHHMVTQHGCDRPDPSTDQLFRSSYQHADESKPCTSCNATQAIPRDRWKRDYDAPAIHYGTIVSSTFRMRNIRDKIKTTLGGICYDREAESFFCNYPMLVIRGIADYGDTHKNEEWEGYAAFTAAYYAKFLIYTTSAQELAKAPRVRDTPHT
ncbi:uncharacterized protein DSM5745_03691 [Aspergillus mulundensis]|uniref:Nucleoside phosphorylase domain-containing protein n=1 Tax=Aspergillus mulundensis TaxID=1810919 RepID=A0A3D8SL42_9EURO|nr:hypothetical protein DSM5745_03691 [Aspergillus mulundensis]RDW87049.1 hypothetical protein DSM5745_03691 [Aspergillus mulundensis]